jgi:hypothetical protein
MTDTTVVTYQLQYRVSGTTQWYAYGVPITGNSELVTGLSPTVSYDFQVIAANIVGAVTSPIVTVVTPGFGAITQLTSATLTSTSTVKAKATTTSKSIVLVRGSGSISVDAIPSIQFGSSSINGAATATPTATTKSLCSTTSNGIVNTTAIATALELIQSAMNLAGSVLPIATVTYRSGASIAGAAITSCSYAQNSIVWPAASNIASIGSVSTYATVIHPQQWSSTHKYTNITLSNNNLTATSSTTAGNSSVYANTNALVSLGPASIQNLAATPAASSVQLNWTNSTITATPNKYYWEVYISCSDPASISVGIGNTSAGNAINQWVGSDANGLGWMIATGVVECNSTSIMSSNTAPSPPTSFQETADTGTTATFTWNASSTAIWPTAGSGSTVCFALDLPNSIVWARVGNGSWCGSSTANPVNGTSGGGLVIPASVLTTALGPACSLNAVGDYCIGHFSSASWSYTPPNGFVSWDTAYNPPAVINVAASNVGNNTLTISWAIP